MKNAIKTGAVVIGRNEGERLKVCLNSTLKQLNKIVYVDSGSTDGSIEFAQSLGIDVISLDMSIPFSAGRARNEGLAFLAKTYPELEYVQFIDGDCELSDGWIEAGESFLYENPQYVMVYGIVKEKFPKKSIYNTLCDIEWYSPSGETDFSGGIFMSRIDTFLSENGFNITMYAGEEPELCYRLINKGWRIYILDNDMARHDANILHFSQWWKRTVRSGYAYALGYFLHRKDGNGYLRKDVARICGWSLLFPLIILISTILFTPWSLLLLLMYILQIYRISKYMVKLINSTEKAFIYALFNVIGKWPQLIGLFIYIRKKIFSRQLGIIEYK